MAHAFCRYLRSGISALRGISPPLPSLHAPMAIQFWMGPDAHLLQPHFSGAAYVSAGIARTEHRTGVLIFASAHGPAGTERR